MNKKGITTIELLICFVIVIVITMSMFSVVSSYNERRITESYKAEIITYKNTLTKDIQDDLIKIGITGATYERTMTKADDADLPVKAVYTVNMDLRDGTKRQLVIEQTLSKSSYHPAGNPDVNDNFMIKYGDPNALTEYPLPNLGSYEDEETHKTILDFSINNVLINIYDEKVLSIYIGFYHPELGTRYCIEITALIDFTFTGAEFVDPSSEHFFIIYNLFGGTVAPPPNKTSFDRRTETFDIKNPTKLGNTFTGWSGTGISGKVPNITIEKGSSGSRTYNANWRSNRSCFYYDLGPGETIASPYTPTNAETRYYTVEDHKIMMSSDAAGTDKHAVEMNALYGGHINDKGLADYNGGAGTFDIKKPGYRPVSGKEWICSSNKCARKTYDMTVVYNDEDICDSSVKDCFVTIQPNWEKVTYSIGYTLNGGSVSPANPTSYDVETNSITLRNPTRVGYTFTGWTGTGLSNASTSVTIPKGSTGNRTYTANWTPNVCTITYSPNGGTFTANVDAVTQTCSYHPTNNCTDDMRNASGGYYSATLTGYNPVSGAEWKVNGGTKTFNQANGYKATDFCSNLENGNQSVTLNVNWVLSTYTITYNLNGGTNHSSNPATYTMNSPAITLQAPTKDNNSFLGWTGSNGAVNQTSVTIPAGSTGDKTYTANWQVLGKNCYKDFDGCPEGYSWQTNGCFEYAACIRAQHSVCNCYNAAGQITYNSTGTDRAMCYAMQGNASFDYCVFYDASCLTCPGGFLNYGSPDYCYKQYGYSACLNSSATIENDRCELYGQTDCPSGWTEF